LANVVLAWERFGTFRSKLLGDGDAGPATRVEDTSPREADDEIIQQRNIGRISTT